MNKYLVMDCSFFVSMILPDENKKFLDLSRYDIIVPSIFYLECMNTLYMALKRQRISYTQLKIYENEVMHLPCEVDNFSSDLRSISSISQLCHKYDITSYDAAYLELALRYNAKIITHDQKLSNASKKAEIEVIC